eukprot:5293476-Pyramimonas_sp.AAC.1
MIVPPARSSFLFTLPLAILFPCPLTLSPIAASGQDYCQQRGLEGGQDAHLEDGGGGRKRVEMGDERRRERTGCVFSVMWTLK